MSGNIGVRSLTRSAIRGDSGQALRFRRKVVALCFALSLALIGWIVAGRPAVAQDAVPGAIGTLLSGISAGAASGWVFAAAMFAGATATTALGRRAGFIAPALS